VERARAEIARTAAEAEVAGVLDSITEGFVLVDRDFRVLRINQEGLRLDRRPASDIVGKIHWEAWPGTEESEMGRLYKLAMERRAPVSFDHFYTFPTGHSAWLELRAYPSGEGLALFYRDITARKDAEYRRKQVEAELRESEERLRVAQEAGAIGTFELFPAAGRIFVSQEFCRIWGVEERSEFRTSQLIALIHPEDRERVKTGLRALPQGALGYIEYRIIRPDTGEVRWLARQGEAVRDRGGETRYLGVSFDITDRKLAEEALRESEDHYQHTVEFNPQVSWTAQPDGQLDHVARRWHDWTGSSGLGSSWGEAMHPDDLQAHDQCVGSFGRNGAAL
jgi:PAS domain S-box-containing protein